MTKNLIIVALVTTNLVFAWYLWRSTGSDAAQPEPVRAQKATPAVLTQTAPHVAGSTPEAPVEFDHTHRNLAAKLREQGFDEAIVRQIVFADMKWQRMLLEQSRPEDYWRRADASPLEQLTEDLAWQAEQRLTLVDLFGEEVVDDPMFENLFKPLNRQLPFLSSNKQIALDELNQRRRAAREEVFRTGSAIREDGEELRESYVDAEEQIRQLLTPDEYFEYRLRQSPIAYSMRRDLGDVINSEQEFRDVFEIRASNVDPTDIQTRRFQSRTDPQVEEKVRTYLGGERYKAYQRASDPRYRVLKSIGELYDNSDSDIIRVYDEISNLTDEISEVQADNALSREEQREKIESMREESYEKIERIAGSETKDSILKNSRRLGLRGWRGGQ
jgi:hypothetical protein